MGPLTAQRVRDLRWVALDLEMTGLDDARDRICEIGLVWGREGRIEGEWGTLVDPGIAMPRAAQAVHGLDAEALRGAPRLETVLPHVIAQLDHAVVVAHRADVDLAFLGRAVARAGLQLPPLHVLDTLSMARRVLALRRNRLVDVGAAFGALTHDAHRALEDARITWHVFVGLLELADPEGVLTVAGLEARLDALRRTSDARAGQRDLLQAALLSRRLVRMSYVSRDDAGHATVTRRDVAVWRIKGSKLEGFCHLRGEARVFRLDRILEVEALATDYQIPAHTSRL